MAPGAENTEVWVQVNSRRHPIDRFFKQKISKKIDILTIQAGIFDLEAGIFTNNMPIWVGTSQKLTIQAG